MDGGAWWGLAAILFLLLVGIVATRSQISGRRGFVRILESIKQNIQELDDFEADDFYVSDQNLEGVAIDLKRQEILLTSATNNTLDTLGMGMSEIGDTIMELNERGISLTDGEEFRRFTVPSIVSCEILEDDEQLAYVNRGSQLAGAAVGGILLGGVGAVIGGLSGSRRNVRKVKKLILRFVTDDFQKPNHDIVLLNDKLGESRDSEEYRQALKVAELWHSRVRTMMMKEGRLSVDEKRT